MSSDWPKVSISDVCELIVDCVNKTAPKVDYETPYKMIRTPNIRNGKITLKDCRFVTKDVFEKWTRRAKVLRGDVLLTREAPMGEVGYVDFDDQVFLGQRIMQYRADKEKLEPRFLLYSFLSKELQHQFWMHEGSGSVVSHIRVPDCSRFELRLPPLNVQRKICNLLGAVDDKVQLNTQVNQTLEQMAQALFKSWFVDFDPVIDNALEVGNPIPETLAERAARRQAMWAEDNQSALARLPAEIRRLFPDRFEEGAVLGWVPEGWKTTRLSDISTELRRGISPKYVEEGGVQVVNQKCIRNHEVNFSLCRRNDPGVKKVDGRLLELGDLLVNSTGTGTLGRVAMIEQLPEPTVVDSHVTIIRTDPTVYPKHVFAQQMIFLEPYVTALGEGSTGQTELSRKMVADIQVVMPTFKCLEQLETKISAFSQARSQNRSQVEVLTQLRDTLLPKLLSGELQLPEAEAAAETALEAEIA